MKRVKMMEIVVARIFDFSVLGDAIPVEVTERWAHFPSMPVGWDTIQDLGKEVPLLSWKNS